MWKAHGMFFLLRNLLFLKPKVHASLSVGCPTAIHMFVEATSFSGVLSWIRGYMGPNDLLLSNYQTTNLVDPKMHLMLFCLKNYTSQCNLSMKPLHFCPEKKINLLISP